MGQAHQHLLHRFKESDSMTEPLPMKKSDTNGMNCKINNYLLRNHRRMTGELIEGYSHDGFK